MRSTADDVVAELRERAVAGRSLRSGDNRGDWLYAAALRHFGSWAAALSGAGFDYGEIKQRPMTGDEVLGAIRGLAEAGDALRAADHAALARAATACFGSWLEAIDAAGAAPAWRTWTREKIVARLREQLAAGEAMTTNAVRRRDENLYAAARREFGNFAGAVRAAKGGRG